MRYWRVKIGFYKDYGGSSETYSESSAEISYDDARTPLDAIRLCAEWRSCPDPATWVSVDVSLLNTQDQPNWLVKGRHP